MSTREIAELTGKRHDNVLTDTRKMLAELGTTSPEFSAHAPDAYGLTVCSPPVNELAGAVGY